MRRTTRTGSPPRARAPRPTPTRPEPDPPNISPRRAHRESQLRSPQISLSGMRDPSDGTGRGRRTRNPCYLALAKPPRTGADAIGRLPYGSRIHHADIREEPHARNDASRVEQPGPDLTRAGRKHSGDHGLPLDDASKPLGVRERDDPTNDDRGPAKSLAHDLGSESCLLVEFPTHRLGRCDIGLDFHGDRSPPAWLEPKYVDRAALAILGVGHLEGDHPAELLEPARHHRDRCRVVLIEQPLELSTPPCRCEAKPCIEREKDHSEGLDRQLSDVAAFDAGDKRLGCFGRASEIHLAPLAAAA